MFFHKDPFGIRSKLHKKSFESTESAPWGLRNSPNFRSVPPSAPATSCEFILSTQMFEHTESILESQGGINQYDITTLAAWRHHTGFLVVISDPMAPIVFIQTQTFSMPSLGGSKPSCMHLCARMLALHYWWSSLCILVWSHNKSSRGKHDWKEFEK